MKTLKIYPSGTKLFFLYNNRILHLPVNNSNIDKDNKVLYSFVPTTSLYSTYDVFETKEDLLKSL